MEIEIENIEISKSKPESETKKKRKKIVPSLSLIGKTINNLEVLALDHIRENGFYYMLCKCTKCGKSTVVAAANIKHSRILSCGCVRSERLIERQTIVPVADYPAIVERYQKGERVVSIATWYGVTRQAITLILTKIKKGEIKI